MKKQGLLILLSFILSACTVSKQSAPIEFNHAGAKQSSSRNKTNPTLVDEGEVVSTGSFEVKSTEVINQDGTNSDSTVDGEQYIIPAQTKQESKHKIIYHEVQVGETIEDIAAKYGQKVIEIALLNELAPPYYLDEFQILKIKQSTEKNLVPTVTGATVTGAIEPLIQVEEGKIKKPEVKLQEQEIHHEYLTPVKGKVITKFGDKTPFGTSKGISISAKPGTKVLSTAAGKVIYADYDATFGNLVIIKLDGKNLVTSYAHLEDIILTKGTSVKQGDVVGYVGSTGKVTEPQLNFGIREGKVAKDPAKFVKY
jgi:murein DD-endopeptidase MepM/ murein hydrolase activator NlpD